MKKIAGIGAGITGITTAYQLMKKGYDVTVFDKQKYLLSCCLLML